MCVYFYYKRDFYYCPSDIYVLSRMHVHLDHRCKILVTSFGYTQVCFSYLVLIYTSVCFSYLIMTQRSAFEKNAAHRL